MPFSSAPESCLPSLTGYFVLTLLDANDAASTSIQSCIPDPEIALSHNLLFLEIGPTASALFRPTKSVWQAEALTEDMTPLRQAHKDPHGRRRWMLFDPFGHLIFARPTDLAPHKLLEALAAAKTPQPHMAVQSIEAVA